MHCTTKQLEMVKLSRKLNKAIRYWIREASKQLNLSAIWDTLTIKVSQVGTLLRFLIAESG